MEPNNMQYRQLLNQIEWTGQRYQNSPYNGGYGMGGSSCGSGNMCCDLCIADQLCECMGGDPVSYTHLDVYKRQVLQGYEDRCYRTVRSRRKRNQEESPCRYRNELRLCICCLLYTSRLPRKSKGTAQSDHIRRICVYVPAADRGTDRAVFGRGTAVDETDDVDPEIRRRCDVVSACLLYTSRCV